MHLQDVYYVISCSCVCVFGYFLFVFVLHISYSSCVHLRVSRRLWIVQIVRLCNRVLSPPPSPSRSLCGCVWMCQRVSAFCFVCLGVLKRKEKSVIMKLTK